jgi:flagellar protein FlgJ
MSPQEKLAKMDGQLKEASKMYEQHFLNEMVKAMRATVHRDDGIVKPNMAENIFSEKLDDQYTQAWAKKGGIGLADMIYQQMHERMFPNKKDFSKPAGPIPFDKTSHPFEIKVDKKSEKSGQVFFQGQAASPLVQPTAVQSPWAGKIESVSQDGNGWSYATIAHDNELRSQLAFRGVLSNARAGDKVGQGQTLGALSLAFPTLRWDVSET